LCSIGEPAWPDLDCAPVYGAHRFETVPPNAAGGRAESPRRIDKERLRELTRKFPDARYPRPERRAARSDALIPAILPQSFVSFPCRYAFHARHEDIL